MTPMTHSINHVEPQIIFGKLQKSTDPIGFFADVTLKFFEELSGVIMKDQFSKELGDLFSFGYWCRRSNLEKLKSNYNSEQIRIGLGETFHITPSNVPINFAYSLAFALLAGNTCTVRVPTREYPQIERFCSFLEAITQITELSFFQNRILIVRYPHSDEITERLSQNASARLIWGGDETVQHISKLASSMRNIDLTFTDRYSLAILSAKDICELSPEGLIFLSRSFYNDVYLFDQNACSSPRLLIWQGENSQIAQAKSIFWQAVGNIVHQDYSVQASHTSSKLLELCNIAMSSVDLDRWYRDENFIDHISVKNLDRNLVDIQNRFGVFFEYSLQDLSGLASFVEPKMQTLTYFGFDKNDLKKLVSDLNLNGIDRIVPVGQALNIGPIWDGYDVPLMLSRIIDVQ